MKNLLILSLSFITIVSCNKNTHKRTKAIDFIPENTPLIFTVNNNEALNSDLEDNEIITLLSKNVKVKGFQSYLSPIKYIKTDNDIVIGLDSDKSYYYTTKYHDSLIIKDTINIKDINSSNYKKKIITKTKIYNDTLFNCVIDSFFIAATNKKYIEDIIDNPRFEKTSNNFKKLKPNTALSIYTNNTALSKSNLTGNLTVLDLDFSQDNLSFIGITKTTDSLPSTTNYLKSTRAKENLLPTIIPLDTKEFISYTFDDYSKITSNYNLLNNSIKSDSLNNIQDLIIEIGTFNIEGSDVFAIRTIDTEAVNETINTSLKETFRQININELESETDLKDFFHPLISYKNRKYSLTINDFIVFTESIEIAQKIISNYTNKSTISNSNNYKNIKERISNESSILYYKMSSELDSVLVNNLPKEFLNRNTRYDLKKNHSQIIQVINDNGFAHVSMNVLPEKKKVILNSISEEFNTSLTNDLLNDPQVVKNHITRQKDIVVQDVENKLYLISNTGKIRWKKKINGNILGDIQQIDIYKNGRLQLVFATPNRVYVLDRNGKDVSPFPKKFNDEITQPLSVFDYDKKRDYRLLVTQGKNILMYNTKGKIVKGFNYKSKNATVNTQPKHFRIGSKDYIVFGAGKKMHILNRKGQTRVTPKMSIDFSNNNIYLYKNKFTTTNSDGQLVQVDQKGGVIKQSASFTPDHKFSTTSKTLAALGDNKLTIKSKSIELDFGEYTAPKIFYLKDKIYVSVTDLQTQKVYLFDSQTKTIPNFPVYGNSSIHLDNLDKDKNLEFVVKGDSNSIILYQLN